MGFKFGNISGRSVDFGNCPVLSMWFGGKKFYPDGSDYIILSSTSATVDSGTSTTYIGVTASTNNWTVSSDSSWLTVSKDTTVSALFSVTENPYASSRVGVLSFQISGVTYATLTVTQEAAATTIVISPTGETLLNASATTGYTLVTASTSNWTVSASPSSAITATKLNNHRVNWSIQANTGSTARNCYITITANGVSVTETIHQPAGYYLEVLTATPMTITPGTTTFYVSVISRFNDQPLQPTSVTFGGGNAIGAAVSSVTQGGGTGQWNYTFTCNPNSTQTQRQTLITFTLDAASVGDIVSDTILIIQNGQEPAPEIGEIVVKAYVGNWVIGTLKTGTTDVPIGTVDVDGIIIANKYPITADHTATVSMVYQTGPYSPGQNPNTYTITNEAKSILSGETMTINGITYYGTWFRTPVPRLQVNQVSLFTVS